MTNGDTGAFDLKGKWLANSVNGFAHVTPIGDAHEHVEDTTCWCRPSRFDGVYVHHSFDGRELAEPDMRPELQEKVQ